MVGKEGLVSISRAALGRECGFAMAKVPPILDRVIDVVVLGFVWWWWFEREGDLVAGDSRFKAMGAGIGFRGVIGREGWMKIAETHWIWVWTE